MNTKAFFGVAAQQFSPSPGALPRVTFDQPRP